MLCLSPERSAFLLAQAGGSLGFMDRRPGTRRNHTTALRSYREPVADRRVLSPSSITSPLLGLTAGVNKAKSFFFFLRGGKSGAVPLAARCPCLPGSLLGGRELGGCRWEGAQRGCFRSPSPGAGPLSLLGKWCKACLDKVHRHQAPARKQSPGSLCCPAGTDAPDTQDASCVQYSHCHQLQSW